MVTQMQRLESNYFPKLVTLDELNQLHSKKIEDKEITVIAQSILRQQKLGENVDQIGEDFLKMCIKRHHFNDAVVELDLRLHANDNHFLLKFNQSAFKRWQDWEIDSNENKVFINFNKFAKFLLDSPLGNQMKIFSDTIKMRDGIPGILFEGEWMSYEEIMQNLEVKFLPEFGEKFMVKKGTEEVYTFLNNGKGIQKHNPYTEISLDHPITILSQEEYERTLASARKFVRKGEAGTNANESRDYIYQIVSSYIDGPKLNASELMYKRKHPWIRVITPEGKVYDCGFGAKKLSKLPGKTTKGRFRINGDIWNVIIGKTKYRAVTNIAISKNEAVKMFKYIKAHQEANLEGEQKDCLAFNLASHNCSAFVHYNTKLLGIKAPTKIYLTDLLKKISPNWLKAIGNGYLKTKAKGLHLLDSVTFVIPNSIKLRFMQVIMKTKQIFKTLLGLIALPFIRLASFALGGRTGNKGRAFGSNLNEHRVIGTRLGARKNFFNLKYFYYHLPGVLHEWQLEQESTVIYHKPKKFVVVAPPEAN